MVPACVAPACVVPVCVVPVCAISVCVIPAKVCRRDFFVGICLFPVFPGKYDTGNFEIFSAGLILKVGEIDFEKCGQIAI